MSMHSKHSRQKAFCCEFVTVCHVRPTRVVNDSSWGVAQILSEQVRLCVGKKLFFWAIVRPSRGSFSKIQIHEWNRGLWDWPVETCGIWTAAGGHTGPWLCGISAAVHFWAWFWHPRRSPHGAVPRGLKGTRSEFNQYTAPLQWNHVEPIRCRVCHVCCKLLAPRWAH